MIFLRKIKFDVAEIYWRPSLEASGQRLDNVNQTHLVLASGKLVLQKNTQTLRCLLTVTKSWISFSIEFSQGSTFFRKNRSSTRDRTNPSRFDWTSLKLKTLTRIGENQFDRKCCTLDNWSWWEIRLQLFKQNKLDHCSKECFSYTKLD